MQEDSLIRPARVNSKKLNNTQMNYGIPKKELLAIVDAVRYFRGLLQGHPVTILTDHQPLVAFISSLQTNQMMIRWQRSLSQLDITIEHIDGNKNVMADAFCRTYKQSPSPPSEESLLSTDHSNSTPVLPTTTTQHLTVNLATYTTWLFITTMPSRTTTNRSRTNMTGRHAYSDEYHPEDWERNL